MIQKESDINRTPHRPSTFKRTALAQLNFQNPKKQKPLNSTCKPSKNDKKKKKQPVLVKGQQLMTKFLRM